MRKISLFPVFLENTNKLFSQFLNTQTLANKQFSIFDFSVDIQLNTISEIKVASIHSLNLFSNQFSLSFSILIFHLFDQLNGKLQNALHKRNQFQSHDEKWALVWFFHFHFTSFFFAFARFSSILPRLIHFRWIFVSQNTKKCEAKKKTRFYFRVK